MAITNYHTVNGEIIGETTSTVRTGYLTDGLGSVTATQGTTGSVLATYRYKPYGALLAKVGSGVDPKFLWCGSIGYRQESSQFGVCYVRGRHYAEITSSWMTVDYLWPVELAYAYCASSPITFYDPTGLLQVVAASNCILNAEKGTQSDWLHAVSGKHLDCVNFSFLSDPKRANEVGVLVQFIERKGDEMTCTKPATITPWATFNFYELWIVQFTSQGKAVVKGGPYPPTRQNEIFDPHDNWRWWPTEGVRRGTMEVKGTIKYKASPDPSWFAMFKPRGVRDAGDAYASLAFPMWASMGSVAATQKLNIEYNTCCTAPVNTSNPCPFSVKRTPNRKYEMFNDCPCDPKGVHSPPI